MYMRKWRGRSRCTRASGEAVLGVHARVTRLFSMYISVWRGRSRCTHASGEAVLACIPKREPARS